MSIFSLQYYYAAGLFRYTDIKKSHLRQLPWCDFIQPYCVLFRNLVVCVQRVVGSVVQSAAFLALESPPRDEVAHVYHVAQLADVAACLYAFEEPFCLLVEHIEAVPRSVQA